MCGLIVRHDENGAVRETYIYSPQNIDTKAQAGIIRYHSDIQTMLTSLHGIPEPRTSRSAAMMSSRASRLLWHHVAVDGSYAGGACRRRQTQATRRMLFLTINSKAEMVTMPGCLRSQRTAKGHARCAKAGQAGGQARLNASLHVLLVPRWLLTWRQMLGIGI